MDNTLDLLLVCLWGHWLENLMELYLAARLDHWTGDLMDNLKEPN